MTSFLSSLGISRSAVFRSLQRANTYVIAKMPFLNSIIEPAKYLAATPFFIYGITKDLGIIKRNLSKVRSEENAEPAKKVALFATVIWDFYFYVLSEGSLAVKLISKGADCNVLYNDSEGFFIKFFDTLHYHRLYFSEKWRIARHVDRFIKRDLSDLYLPYSSFDLPPDSEIAEIARTMISDDDYGFKGVDLRYQVDISIARYYRSAPQMTDHEQGYDNLLFEFTFNSVKAVLLAETVVQTVKPDTVIMSHPIYSFWGPMYEYFKEVGVKVVLYRSNSLFKPSSIVFDIWNIPPEDMEKIHSGELLDDDEVSSIERRAREIMEQRFSLGSHDMKLFNTDQSDVNVRNMVAKLENIRDRGKKIYGMFPNLIYDFYHVTKDGAFTYITDWVSETVEYFERQEDKHLVLKLHPVEANPRYKPKENPISIIERRLGIPVDELKNVTIIRPEDKIVSYQLIPHITAAILYTGTLGIELLYQNVPVINGTNIAPYSRRGFTVDPDDKEQYFHYIEHPEEVLAFQEENFKKILIFIYLYFDLCFVPFSFLADRSVDPQTDPNLEKIANIIMDEFAPGSYIDNIFGPAVREL